jgi:uncharacterized protein (TIGR00369 family)
MNPPSPLAQFLNLTTDAEHQPPSTRMPLGSRTRNSYGAPLGGAVGSLIVEAAQAGFPDHTLHRIHVRFLRSVKGGLLHAECRAAGTDCEVRVCDDRARLAAFGIAAFGTTGTTPPALASVARAWRGRPWGDVPLLNALDIEEDDSVSDEVCCEMRVSPLTRNADETLHTGAVFTLVDLAAGQLAQRCQPPGPVVTLDAELRMWRPPATNLVRARATVLHAGRRIVTATVVVDDAVHHIAHATVTMLRVGQ